MKAIKWVAGIGIATASLTAILLSTASAGDVVYRVTDRHTLTPAQAGSYFASIAADKCTLAVGKTHQLAVKRISVVSDSSTDIMYGWTCVSKDSGTLGAMLDAMETAGKRPFKDLGVKEGVNYWSITTVGAMTPASAASYLAGFAAARCRTSAAKVVKIIVTKQGLTYHAECSGVDVGTLAEVQALRVDASTDAMMTVQVLGRVE